jgi:hypothetical protein
VVDQVSLPVSLETPEAQHGGSDRLLIPAGCDLFVAVVFDNGHTDVDRDDSHVKASFQQSSQQRFVCMTAAVYGKEDGASTHGAI